MTERSWSLSEFDVIEVTFVDRWRSALASASFAIRSRMALYVLAKKRFSKQRQS